MTKLNDSQLRKLKPTEKTQKISDGLGLTFVLKPNGSRYWHFNYRWYGKQRTISFGTYPETTLKSARDQRTEAREFLAQKADPSAERKNSKLAAREAETTKLRATTWREVSNEYLELQERKGRAPKTIAKIKSQLAHTYIDLAALPIEVIHAPELLAMTKKIEAQGKLTTAVQVRELCGRVFRYGMATGVAKYDPTPALRGALMAPPRRHYPGIVEPMAVGGLIRSIRSLGGGEPTTRVGLLLLAYTFQRPGEIRHLQWSDIDWENRKITIPAERMKMKRPHVVPLSNQTIDLLKEILPWTGQSQYIFSGTNEKSRPISDATFASALKRLGYDSSIHVPHGFRTTASTLLNEDDWNRDWIERQLAHVERNAIRRAYNAAEYLDGRVKMMQAYSDKLDELALQT
jgi:integrase